MLEAATENVMKQVLVETIAMYGKINCAGRMGNGCC